MVLNKELSLKIYVWSLTTPYYVCLRDRFTYKQEVILVQQNHIFLLATYIQIL